MYQNDFDARRDWMKVLAYELSNKGVKDSEEDTSYPSSLKRDSPVPIDCEIFQPGAYDTLSK